LERSGSRFSCAERIRIRAGQQLYDYAQQICESIGKQWKPFRLTNAISGELFLAASSIPGHFLPDMVANFSEISQIRVRATILDSLAAIHEVESGMCIWDSWDKDRFITLSSARSPRMKWSSSCQQPSRQRRRTVSFKQFARQPLILRSQARVRMYQKMLSDSA
jgi:DNA-binding transcriptional LysR family regulator